MSIVTMFLSPLSLLFFIIIAGVSIGKIRIGRVSIGSAGILFVAILIGFIIGQQASQIQVENFTNIQSTMQIFSRLGTSLFVSVIGLQSGFSVQKTAKNSLVAFAIGVFMSVIGVCVMLLISMLDKTISYPSLLGVLCGALTSTPGLSSVCELLGTDSGEVILGYGASYLLGVIFVVFFAQFFSRNIPVNDIKNEKNAIVVSKTYPELILIGLVVFFGKLLANIYIPFTFINFGDTPGMLLFGLIVGYVARRKKPTIEISVSTLNNFRNFGLALFFSGTGITTGMNYVSFDIKTIFYGALITLCTILCGYILCKTIFSRYQLHNGFIIAGGLTSSPAYGAISSKANEASINHFSFAYFGALISLIFVLQIIVY